MDKSWRRMRMRMRMRISEEDIDKGEIGKNIRMRMKIRGSMRMRLTKYIER